jgi:hypothetical protein
MKVVIKPNPKTYTALLLSILPRPKGWKKSRNKKMNNPNERDIRSCSLRCEILG